MLDGSRVNADYEKLIGRTLAKRYRIVRRIGTGGMGVVFEALHVELGRPVALKVLHQTDERALARFHQEALATAKLDSPHIVTITDYHEARGARPAFIVMELLAGTSLRDVIHRDGVLATDTAVRIADQLLSALATAHRAGIVHRDVKPANILLVPETPGAAPIVKLLDFGVAKLAVEAGGMKTTVGTVLGTPAYLAPEQILGGAVDARTDVHAVGLVVREMLVGKRLWAEARGAELGRAIALEVPPRVTRSDVPAELAALIARALEKDPDARFADAATMRDALRSIALVDMPLSEITGASDTHREPEPATVRNASTQDPPATPRDANAVRRPVPVVGLAALVLAAAAGFVALVPRGRDGVPAEPASSVAPEQSPVTSLTPMADPVPPIMPNEVEPRPPATFRAESVPDARAPVPVAVRPPAASVLPSSSALPSSPAPPRPAMPRRANRTCEPADRDPFTGRCP